MPGGVAPSGFPILSSCWGGHPSSSGILGKTCRGLPSSLVGLGRLERPAMSSWWKNCLAVHGGYGKLSAYHSTLIHFFRMYDFQHCITMISPFHTIDSWKQWYDQLSQAAHLQISRQSFELIGDEVKHPYRRLFRGNAIQIAYNPLDDAILVTCGCCYCCLWCCWDFPLLRLSLVYDAISNRWQRPKTVKYAAPMTKLIGTVRYID